MKTNFPFKPALALCLALFTLCNGSLSPAYAASNSATALAASKSFALAPFSGFVTNLGFVTNFVTTFDGTSAVPLMATNNGKRVVSFEARPDGIQPGSFQADYLTYNNLGVLVQYGTIVSLFAPVDSDSNGLLDFEQKSFAANSVGTGTATPHWPAGELSNMTGTYTRAAGSDSGTYSLSLFNSFGSVDYTGVWRLVTISGSVQYTRGSSNFLTWAVNLTDPEGSLIPLHGTSSFTVSGKDQIALDVFTLQTADNQTYAIQASTLSRKGNKYSGQLHLVDGFLATPWADYTEWILEITDTNDADSNGIPDLSDTFAAPVAPQILQQPTGGWFLAGGQVSLSVEAAGTLPLNYQWLKDGTNLVGQTAATLVLPNLGAASEGIYSVVVSNSEGSIGSQPVVVRAGELVDSSFTTSATIGSGVHDIALDQSGRILIGGEFVYVNGVDQRRLARLNAEGALDIAFKPVPFDLISSIQTQADGKVVVGGFFNMVSGITRTYVARINADGTLDSGFNPTLNSAVRVVALQGDGKILLGGDFQQVNGTAHGNLVRLNADGSTDSSFTVNASGSIYAIALQPDGKIVVAGAFNQINGVTRNAIARLNANGSLDEFFNVASSGLATGSALALQADGKILAADLNISGVNKALVRLNSDGSVDSSYNAVIEGSPISPGQPSHVSAILVASDGKIIIGGSFLTVGGIFSQCLARLNADGAPDLSFNIGEGVKDSGSLAAVSALSFQGPDKLLVGGQFLSIAGVGRTNFARLNLKGVAATPELKATAPTISAGKFGIRLEAPMGAKYYLEYKNSLSDPEWTTLQVADGNDYFINLYDSTPLVQSRFYRIRKQ